MDSKSMMNIEAIRDDFPILYEKVNSRNLIYFDNAATTHKPKKVIQAMSDYNNKIHSNAHRGAHALSVLATEAYENVREKVKQFLNAKKAKEIIFTKNATEALNLLAYSYGMHFIKEEDEILLTIAEHHSNILPWQRVAKFKKAKLNYLVHNEESRLTMEEIKKKITKKTKVVSLCQMSNVLGTVHPIKEIIEYAHEMGAIVIVDGAQSIPHMKVDVQDLNADFFVFSAHKMLGPMGVGVLYGKQSLLESMPPFLFGGQMIEYVNEYDATYAPIPYKFEAGTPNVEGVVGLGAAIDYLNKLGMAQVKVYEKELTSYALEKLLNHPFIDVYGPKTTENRGAVISFNIKEIHPHDVSSILDQYGIALRAGHHCAQLLMKHLEVSATCRISLYFYNTKEEIDYFIDHIKEVRKWLGYGS